METPSLASATLDRDLPCGRCGYNLRTLPMEGKCPECGVAVRRTVEAVGGGTPLRAVNAYYRRGLVMGLLLFAGADAGWIAKAVINGQGYDSALLSKYAPSVILTLALAGIWLLTDPEPDALKPERSYCLRRILRWGALAAAAAFIAALYAGVRNVLIQPGERTGAYVVISVVLVAFTIFFLVSALIAQLVRRIPARGLGRIWSVTAWGGLASSAFCLGPNLLFPSTPPSGALAPLVVAMVPIVLSSVLCLLLVYTAIVIWRAGTTAQG